MKSKIFKLSLLAFIFIGINACSSDDDADNGMDATINNLFDVQDADLQNRDFPSSNSEATLEIINMNTNVIPGGTSYATIQTSTPAQKLLIGAENEFGYYELPVEDGSDQNFILKINQLNQEESFSVRLAYLDVDNQISQSIVAELQVINVGTGSLQVNLSFDNDKDVDLHLIEPNGGHIYYASMMSENGGELDLDSNPACSIDGINNENITYSEEAQLDAGTYDVYVDMYSNCDPSIATNFVVTAKLDGVEINTHVGNFPIDFPSNGGGSDIANDIEPVFSFTISEEGARPMPDKMFKPKRLTQSAKEKLEISKNR
ncbi:MAG: hypothetical protein L0J45_07290 [Psychroflexus sp.]|nr:hypothetical protein [Psychroflexus sp.]